MCLVSAVVVGSSVSIAAVSVKVAGTVVAAVTAVRSSVTAVVRTGVTVSVATVVAVVAGEGGRHSGCDEDENGEKLHDSAAGSDSNEMSLMMPDGWMATRFYSGGSRGACHGRWL